MSSIIKLAGFLSIFIFSLGGSVRADSVLGALTEAAGNEDGEAQVILGQIYSRGDGVEQDDLIAAHWFERAAENGEALGQYFYAWSLQEGYGVAQDMTKALVWYRASAEQGNGDATEMVRYLERQIVDQVADVQEQVGKDEKSEVIVLTPASSEPKKPEKNISADFLKIRANFNLSSDKPEQVVNFLIEQKLSNRAEEKNFIGYLIARMARVGNKNLAGPEYVDAYHWFLSSAQLGNAAGQYNLAYSLMTGQGVARDLSAAERWFLIAQETFQAFIPRDYDELTAEFRQASEYKDGYDAARQGYESANRELGELIQLGLDESKARRRMNN